MITFDLKRIFEERGIKNPFTELVKLGITQPAAHRILNNGVKSINLEHIEKICLFLNCTPDDLLSYSPSLPKKSKIRPGEKSGDEALLKLRRDPAQKPLSEILRTISIEQINQLREVLTSKP